MLFMLGGRPIAFMCFLLLIGLAAHSRLSVTRFAAIWGWGIPIFFLLNYRVFVGGDADWFLNPFNVNIPISNTIMLVFGFLLIGGVAAVPVAVKTNSSQQS